MAWRALVISISPKSLSGPWKAGFALDVHTLSSELIGYDEWGHEVFDTKRSDMGELLYRLKYQSDRTATRIITETVAEFVRTQHWDISLITAVPPSTHREFQPVLTVAEAVASTLEVPYCSDCVVKVRETPQLKNIFEFQQRSALLEGAFSVSKNAMVGKNVLLFDDLYRSGATLRAIAFTLVKNAGIQELFVLTLTMTRTRR